LELRPGATFTVKKGAIQNYRHALPMPTTEEVDAKVQELNDAEAMRLLRELRNSLLDECDKVIMKYTTICMEPAKWAPSKLYQRHLNASDRFIRVTPPQWIRFMDQLRDLPQNAKPRLTSQGELDLASFILPRIPISTGMLCLCTKADLVAFCERHTLDRDIRRQPILRDAPHGNLLDDSQAYYIKVDREIGMHNEDNREYYAAIAKEDILFMTHDGTGYTLNTTSNCALPPLLAKYKKLLQDS
jgi:hypothetical protein